MALPAPKSRCCRRCCTACRRRSAFGAEADFSLPDTVETTLTGGDLTRHEGVFLPAGRRGPPSRPLADLSRLPVPDFADFPRRPYRTRVVPVMTGRGYSWRRCLFCSDVDNGE